MQASITFLVFQTAFEFLTRTYYADVVSIPGASNLLNRQNTTFPNCHIKWEYILDMLLLSNERKTSRAIPQNIPLCDRL